MGNRFKDCIALFSQGDTQSLFKYSKHALEKEMLRVDNKGHISMRKHPESLGAALTHPYISTDFSEAQLELITPPFHSIPKVIDFLSDLERFIVNRIDDEMFWPFSMPCILPTEGKLPLAKYGPSSEGQNRELYRRGLAYRYGGKMQTMSGIHYNFSFSEEFWDYFSCRSLSSDDRKSFISNSYLHIVRNFLRWGWLHTYFFGTSPWVDKSYFEKEPAFLKLHKNRIYYGDYATSIRLSTLGYYSKGQAQKRIRFNGLEEYIRDLEYAVSTPYDAFQRLGVFRNGERRQLNANILQQESEHYSRIRPKPNIIPGCRPLDVLKGTGVSYLEIRAVDLDPFELGGIRGDQLHFLYAFIVYCLFKGSKPIGLSEQKEIIENQSKMSLKGRYPKLKLRREGKPILMREWAQAILKEMDTVAQLLDEQLGVEFYSRALERQKAKLEDSKLTPSFRIQEELIKGNKTMAVLAREFTEKHIGVLKEKKMSHSMEKMLSEECVKSLQKKKEQQVYDDFILKGYEDLETSTQMIIREAIKRGIYVEVLDRNDNFIRLKKGKKEEFVRQATETSKDSIITYFLMANKFVTKNRLLKKGFSVPLGKVYTSKKEAIEAYDEHRSRKVVVKPNSTNYGVGISFISPHDKKAYQCALEEAFKLDKEVIVEEFCSGKEYRFLVINNKVVAACRRIPANVIGDGKSTVNELVKAKNADLNFYKIEKYRIRLGKRECIRLASQGLGPKSIPKKGKQIFLRKNSNVSTGGDSIDVTDLIPKVYKDLAVRAVKDFKATFCGIDIIITDLEAKPSKGNYKIIELNYNPALFLHRYPIEGKTRYIEKDVLDALGF